MWLTRWWVVNCLRIHGDNSRHVSCFPFLWCDLIKPLQVAMACLGRTNHRRVKALHYCPYTVIQWDASYTSNCHVSDDGISRVHFMSYVDEAIIWMKTSYNCSFYICQECQIIKLTDCMYVFFFGLWTLLYRDSPSKIVNGEWWLVNGNTRLTRVNVRTF